MRDQRRATRAKTDDHFFLGFPNYWNLVAFYLYCLGYGTTFNVTVLLIFGVMAFGQFMADELVRWDKVRQGVTTVAEVLRVTREEV